MCIRDSPEGYADRIAFLISHHHTIDQIDGMDYQILIEADYLVNACLLYTSRCV